ncbi:MAG: crossover junction endodeoxyribonuclease RuvC [Calditrichota bacterium]
MFGIDPGLVATGYGVVERLGSRVTPLVWGVIRSGGRPLPDRLKIIYDKLRLILTESAPDLVCIEEVFSGRNPRSALLVGHARGAAILAAAAGGYEVREFSARTVKQAVVGRGAASKDQVSFMVSRLLNMNNVKIPRDAADALAVALCGLFKGPGISASS